MAIPVSMLTSIPRVFEPLLRFRANYFFSAQWNSMFNIDDSRNQNLADEYGIVMGTSRTESMMRATREKELFVNGSWDWASNDDSVYQFMM